MRILSSIPLRAIPYFWVILTPLLLQCSKAIIAVTLIPISVAFAKDLSPEEIVARVGSTYRALGSYRSEGTVKSSGTINGRTHESEISFELVLKKPNLFRIRWDERNTSLPKTKDRPTGILWSKGADSFHYMGVDNSYSKITGHVLAFASGTGVSHNVSYFIPILFFDPLPNFTSWLTQLSDVKLQRTETIGMQRCYVLVGKLREAEELVIWVSAETFHILRIEESSKQHDLGDDFPKPDTADIDESIKAMGQIPDDANRKKIQEIMDFTRRMVKGVSIETRTVHTFQNVSSPRLSEDAFEFKLPSDAVEQGDLSVPAELSKLLDSGALGTAETEIPEASK